MLATCGLPSATPLAYLDPDSSSWRTSQATFLLEDPQSLQTLPDSGFTHDGWLYELPTWERATAVRGSSSLLPTPVAQDDNKSAEAHVAKKVKSGAGAVVTSLDVMARQAAATGSWSNNISRASGTFSSLAREMHNLLPTPTSAAADGGNLSRSGARKEELLLPGLVKTFVPTPTSTDAKSSSGSNPEWGHGVTLTDFARSVSTPTPSPATNTPLDE